MLSTWFRETAILNHPGLAHHADLLTHRIKKVGGVTPGISRSTKSGSIGSERSGLELGSGSLPRNKQTEPFQNVSLLPMSGRWRTSLVTTGLIILGLMDGSKLDTPVSTALMDSLAGCFHDPTA